MIQALLLASLAAVVGAGELPAELQANPEGYWNKSFSCAGSAEHYEMTLVVEDAPAAAAKVHSVMTAAGGTNANGGTSASINSFGYDNLRGNTFQYFVPLKVGEKSAKKLWDLGELMNYSVRRQAPEDAVKAIDERIAAVEEELEVTESIGEKIPTARYFLKSRLSSLRQQRGTCENGANRSIISVSVMTRSGKR